MKKYLSVLLAVITLLSIFSFGTTVFADQHEPGWVFEDGGWMYYENGSPYCDGIYNIKGNGYYFNYQGKMQTGWIYEDVSYTDPETSEYVQYYVWYYAESNGVLTEGWKQINNVWYYFEPAAYYMYANGMFDIGNKTYIFKESGAMLTGWFHSVVNSGYVVYDLWYYADSNGNLAKGWRQVGGKWYYFDLNEGWMYSNTTERINGKLYYFTKSGAMLANGWGQSRWGDWYYADKNGALATGWQQISGKWYYFDAEEGFMYVGGHQIGNKLYLFDGSGAWYTQSGTGWKSIKITFTYENKTTTYTEWFYFEKGKLATGWRKLGGKWYYFDNGSGMMLSDGAYKTADSKVYYFEASGAMKTTEGWAKETYADGAVDWYYVNSNGTCVKGWKYVNGKWYYFDNEWAYMHTGFTMINDKVYYFNESGAMVTGTQTINGKDYLFDENGVLIKGENPFAVG